MPLAARHNSAGKTRRARGGSPCVRRVASLAGSREGGEGCACPAEGLVVVGSPGGVLVGGGECNTSSDDEEDWHPLRGQLHLAPGRMWKQ